ncbi:hypothetical protein NDU88_007204 [Pleurodeles waltl]|uniref:Uncharacterized protein n=1 Tax=Pleurodeles waltl TaxID=8319 RepID=A0AAV7LU52_PLEWA|nr:hypothetical protein NDU88_007204 [Pleurodeles waltl]
MGGGGGMAGAEAESPSAVKCQQDCPSGPVAAVSLGPGWSGAVSELGRERKNRIGDRHGVCFQERDPQLPYQPYQPHGAIASVAALLGVSRLNSTDGYTPMKVPTRRSPGAESASLWMLGCTTGAPHPTYHIEGHQGTPSVPPGREGALHGLPVPLMVERLSGSASTDTHMGLTPLAPA